jgi:hypothetical protein
MVNIELGINLGRKRCKKCGAPLRSGFRTCERCGEPVSGQAADDQPAGEQAAQPNPQQGAGDEAVIGVIANAAMARTFGRKTYNLVVTNKRLIGAELTSKMIAEEAERVSREAKARGEGLMARMGQRAYAGVNLYQRYYTMPVEDIVAENKDNWSIPVEEIQSCKMDEEDNGYPTQLTIQWTQGKYTFIFDAATLGSGRVKAEDAKAILKQAGVKVK